MQLTQEQIKKLRRMTKLSEEKIQEMWWSLGEILDYMEELNQVNTEGLDWVVNVIDKYNPLREDDIKEKNQDILSNSKQKVVWNQIVIDNIMK